MRPPFFDRASASPDRLAAWVRGVRGWRRAGLAFLLGLMAAAALPPIHFLPLLVVAFTGLVWLIDTARPRAVLGISWLFSLGYFVAGLYWLVNALMTDPARFAWLVPFALFGLPAVLAVFSALGLWAARRLGAPGGRGAVLGVAVGWSAAEWARGHVLTGFPWNLVAHVWDFSAVMIQPVAVIGVYGLGLLTVAVVASPAALCPPPGTMAGARRRGRVGVALGLVLIGGLWAAGEMRLQGADRGTVPGVKLRLVQPNIAQSHKWRDDLREAQFADYLRLTTSPGVATITHVIWPETAVPYVLAGDPLRRQRMALATPPGGQILTGAVRATPPGEHPYRVWNSLQAVDDSGALTATYDKVHLVPFGEYMPLRRLLNTAKITQGGTDFSPGQGLRTLQISGLPPLSPLICYEAIFPGEVVDRASPPAWMLNITNDGWYGISSGPYQHFAAARLRAVEQGIPLVRAANTGISAVVDSYGRITARLGLGVEGVLDAALPVALTSPPPYVYWGDIPFLFLLAIFALMSRLIR